MTTAHETDSTLPRWQGVIWIGFVVVALVALDVVGPTVYGVGVPAAAAVLYLATRSRARAALRRSLVGRQDLVVVGALYLAVVACRMVVRSARTAAGSHVG